jgi:hypothetical protein
MARLARMVCLACLAAACMTACEAFGPAVDVTVLAEAPVTPAYPVFKVLFRFYADREVVQETVADIAGGVATARHARSMGPGDTLGVTAAVYWNRSAGEFVQVSAPESRTLAYAEARKLAEQAGAGGGLACTWRVSLPLRLE